MKNIIQPSYAKCLILLAILSGTSFLSAQTIDRFVISSTGQNLSTDNYSMVFTLGEPIAGTLTNEEQLSQGFHQEWVVITAVDHTAEQLTNVTVFPNPTFGVLNIKTEDEIKASFFDANGRMVMEQKVGTGVEEMNISELPAGLYYLHLKSAAGNKQTSFKISKLE